MAVYSSIEFFTCLAVIFWGDCHKLYQSSLLFMMLCLHFAMEAALTFDSVWFIESEIYTYAMSGLIIAQLIGASRGMDKISRPDSHRRKNNHPTFFHHQTCNNFSER
jgi:hypothetical protein